MNDHDGCKAAGTRTALYFVCYSRKQRDFVAKVEAKLASRRRRGELDVWRDVRNLDVWEEFTEVILAALERAAGAIVIISDDWYQSDYIQDHEWRTIKAREERDPWFKIFPLAFNDLDSHDPLRCRNFVNDLTNELLLDCSDAVRDRVLTRLSDLIGDHARLLHQRSVPVTEPSPVTAVPVDSFPQADSRPHERPAPTRCSTGFRSCPSISSYRRSWARFPLRWRPDV